MGGRCLGGSTCSAGRVGAGGRPPRLPTAPAPAARVARGTCSALPAATRPCLQWKAKKVILATGVRDLLPDVEGFETCEHACACECASAAAAAAWCPPADGPHAAGDRPPRACLAPCPDWGHGVWVCLYCDAYEYRGQALAAYGNGERGVHIALEASCKGGGREGRGLLWVRPVPGLHSAAATLPTLCSALCARLSLRQMLLWSKDITLFTDGQPLEATELVRWAVLTGRSGAGVPTHLPLLAAALFACAALPAAPASPALMQERQLLEKHGVRVIEARIARSALPLPFRGGAADAACHCTWMLARPACAPQRCAPQRQPTQPASLASYLAGRWAARAESWRGLCCVTAASCRSSEVVRDCARHRCIRAALRACPPAAQALSTRLLLATSGACSSTPGACRRRACRSSWACLQTTAETSCARCAPGAG